ncbi:aminoglycoside phosphotransferase family protein [Shewanella zhangzhouensis]|uniref:aminoglycoside phosphotransferase family protein n=1 Tax=Shewanella zhangzhouensis TaxID=2864213 RepID=UPI001C65E943|nr:phosphotransferase [Shewanella zhangzhouensis]QYK04457.1 phosphotransferase [Shewanella zhangzhouensis]
MLAIIKQFFAKSHGTTVSDSRFLALNHWLSNTFGAPLSPVLISGDASFRRYFRAVHQGRAMVIMDTPVALIPTEPFVAVRDAYAAAGLPVPAIIAKDDEQGFMALEDFGDVQLLSLLNSQSVRQWYPTALALLPGIAAVTQTALGPLPDYDDAFVRRELGIFTEWLLGTHLKLELTSDEKAIIADAFDMLTENALEQPRVGMHRDFHSRNLMVVDGELKLLDFQDAVLGPVTYDAVSLLRDCYIRWSEDLVDDMLVEFFVLAHEHALVPPDTDMVQFRRWFELMGLQRHIKAAGIFARLNHRDGKAGYLKDIPLTMHYIRDVAVRYKELGDFAQFIMGRVMPALEASA